MRKYIHVLFILLGIAILSAISACYEYSSQLTDKQASEIAQPYFQKAYKMNVVIENVEYQRVSQKQYLNFITVSNNGTKYELVLDERNKPLADNVSDLETIKNTDLSSLNNKIEPSKLGLKGFGDLYSSFSYQDRRYLIQDVTATTGIPNRNSKDGIFSLLGMMKNIGVDKFIIEIGTPDFLLSKTEFGYGAYGIQLVAETFDTNVDKISFEDQYYDFTSSVFWDEQKFEEKESELTEIGYKNANFYISKYIDGNTIEIILYCESETGLHDDSTTTFLGEMDDGYFKIKGKETKYTLQRVYK